MMMTNEKDKNEIKLLYRNPGEIPYFMCYG